MFSLRELIDYSASTYTQSKDGRWMPARPLVGPLAWRVRDAWAVLTGRADAVTWPVPERETPTDD